MSVRPRSVAAWAAVPLLSGAAAAAVLEARPVLPVCAPSAAAPASAGALSLLSAPSLAADPGGAVPVLAPSPAPLALSPADGVYERRGLGLLAVDVKDSTAMHLALGNRKAHRLIAGALDFAADSAAAFDGVVVRRLGDGHLIVFPTFEKALAAGFAMQSGLDSWRRAAGADGLELRVGAHAGRGLIDATGVSPEVYGEPVERALALSASGRGGDVAVAPGLARPAADLAPPATGRSAAEDGSVLLRPRARRAVPDAGVQPLLATERFVRAATLFAGLADWPARYARDGRRAAHATTKAFHAFVAEVVARNGGLFVKTEGETVMAVFPSPRDAVRAAAALQSGLAAALRDSPLGARARARVGVSWGRALREDRLEGPDFFGNTVNAAARLMRLAAPGEAAFSGSVLDDPAAAELLRGAERGTARVKGFAEPLTVLRLRPG